VIADGVLNEVEIDLGEVVEAALDSSSVHLSRLRAALGRRSATVRYPSPRARPQAPCV
jgi:hypothetical protein